MDKTLFDIPVNEDEDSSDFDITCLDQFGFNDVDQDYLNSQAASLDAYENSRALSLSLFNQTSYILRHHLFQDNFRKFLEPVIMALCDGFAFGTLEISASIEETSDYLLLVMNDTSEDNDDVFGIIPDGMIIEKKSRPNPAKLYPEDCQRVMDAFREAIANWSITNPQKTPAEIEPENIPFLPFPVRSRLISSEGFKRNPSPLYHDRSILEGDERELALAGIRKNIFSTFNQVFYDALIANDSRRNGEGGKRHVMSGPSGIGKTQAFLERLVADPESYVRHTRVRGRPGEERQVNAPYVIMMRTHAEMDRAIATMKVLRLDPKLSDEEMLGALRQCGWLSRDYHNVEGALREARDMIARCRLIRKVLTGEIPEEGPLPHLMTKKWMSRSKGGCLISDTVDVISQAGLSPSRLCRVKGEDEQMVYCRHHEECPWVNLQESLSVAQVVFLPTSYLKGDGLPDALKYPYMIVIDGDVIDCRISTEILEMDSLALRFLPENNKHKDEEEIELQEAEDQARLWVFQNIMGFAQKCRDEGIVEKGKRSLRDPAWGFALALALIGKGPIFRQAGIDEKVWNPFKNGMLTPIPKNVSGLFAALEMTSNILIREIAPEMGVEPNMGHEEAILLARQSVTPQIMREKSLFQAVQHRMKLLADEADEAARAMLKGEEQPFYPKDKQAVCGEWDHRIQWVEKRLVVRGGGVKKLVDGIRFSCRSNDTWQKETIFMMGNFQLASKRRVQAIQNASIVRPERGKSLTQIMQERKEARKKEGGFVRRSLALANSGGVITHEDILQRLWGDRITIHNIVEYVDVGRLNRVRTVLFPEMEYRRSEMEGYAHGLFSRQARSAAMIVRMQKFLGLIAATHGTGRVMLASRKGAMEAMLHSYPLPVNMDGSHYGNLQNISLKNRPEALVTVGAFETHPDTIDGIVGALTFDLPEPETPLDLRGTGRDAEGKPLFPPYTADYYRLRNGGQIVSASKSYPGRWAEIINTSVREEEISKAYGQLSPFYREDVALFYVVGRILPPGSIIDEALSLEDVLPTENMPDWNARYRWANSPFQKNPHYETYWAKSAQLPNTMTERYGQSFNPSGLPALPKMSDGCLGEPIGQDSLIEVLGHEMALKKAVTTLLSHAVSDQGGLLFPWAVSVSPSIQLPVALRSERNLISMLEEYGFQTPFMNDYGDMCLPEFPEPVCPFHTRMDAGWVGGLFFTSPMARPHPFWMMTSEFGEPDFLDQLGFARIALQVRLAYFYAFGEMPDDGGLLFQVNGQDAWVEFGKIPEEMVAELEKIPSMGLSEQRQTALQTRMRLAGRMDDLTQTIVHCREGQLETPLISQNAYVNDFESKDVLTGVDGDTPLYENRRHLVPIRQIGVEAFGRGLWMSGQMKAAIAKARLEAGLRNYDSPDNSEADKKRFSQDVVAMSHSKIPYDVMLTWFSLQETYEDGAGLLIEDLHKKAEQRARSLPASLVEKTEAIAKKRMLEKDLPSVFGIFPHSSPLLSNYEIVEELGFEGDVKIGEDV